MKVLKIEILLLLALIPKTHISGIEEFPAGILVLARNYLNPE